MGDTTRQGFCHGQFLPPNLQRAKLFCGTILKNLRKLHGLAWLWTCTITNQGLNHWHYQPDCGHQRTTITQGGSHRCQVGTLSLHLVTHVQFLGCFPLCTRMSRAHSPLPRCWGPGSTHNRVHGFAKMSSFLKATCGQCHINQGAGKLNKFD